MVRKMSGNILDSNSVSVQYIHLEWESEKIKFRKIGVLTVAEKYLAQHLARVRLMASLSRERFEISSMAGCSRQPNDRPFHR